MAWIYFYIIVHFDLMQTQYICETLKFCVCSSITVIGVGMRIGIACYLVTYKFWLQKWENHCVLSRYNYIKYIVFKFFFSIFIK